MSLWWGLQLVPAVVGDGRTPAFVPATLLPLLSFRLDLPFNFLGGMRLALSQCGAAERTYSNQCSHRGRNELSHCILLYGYNQVSLGHTAPTDISQAGPRFAATAPLSLTDHEGRWVIARPDKAGSFLGEAPDHQHGHHHDPEAQDGAGAFVRLKPVFRAVRDPASTEVRQLLP